MKYLMIVLYPFIGTIIGSSFVFLFSKINQKIKVVMLGIASGVMLASSIWSLIIPSIELSEPLNIFKWLPTTIGILIGILFLILSEKLLFIKQNKSMMNFVVTLHNIPEGMAVGVVLASHLLNKDLVSYYSVFALSMGIAIQNIPEGAIIALNERVNNKTKFKAFIKGMLSGIVEPLFAIITIISTNIINTLLPYILSFAAGAMIYVVVEELIPEAKIIKSKLLILSLTIGFIIMMILDIMLG